MIPILALRGGASRTGHAEAFPSLLYIEVVALVVQIADSFASTNPRSFPREPHRRGSALLPFPGPPPRRNVAERWHLLSLDAPTVAALWTWFLASANGLRLPWTSVAAMATAVWLLYAGDRLLDSRALAAEANNGRTLEARHYFHHRHRVAFRWAIGVASVVLAVLLPTLPANAMHLYLVEGSFLAGYFLLIHTVPHADKLPKEFAVGLFFAAAVFIHTVARQPGLRLSMLAPGLLFAALCILNCLLIHAWEHPEASPESAHISTRIALRHLVALAGAIVLGSGAALLDARIPWTIPAAIALSSGLLVCLHQAHRRLTPTTLRAAADLVLLTPLIFLLF